MLIAAMLVLNAGSPGVVPAASAALRGNARTALPAAAFARGLAIFDEQGAVVGKVVSSEQGLVTMETAHTLIRVPASAFLLRGGLVLIAMPVARIDTLVRNGQAAGSKPATMAAPPASP